MQTSVDIGRVGLWQSVLDQQPTSAVTEIVGEIEAMGWPCVWLPEAMGRDAFVSAAVLLGASKNLKVATGIAQIHARHPMTTANAQRTIAEAYGNRFLLGLGVSHEPFIAGVRKTSYAKPFSQMRDYLEAMAEAPFMAVGPAEAPPTILAALGPRMLELAATKANGSHPYFSPPEHTAAARAILGPGPLLAPEQMVLLETDPTKAREIARKAMSVYLGLPNYTNNLLRHGFTEADIAGPSNRLIDTIVAWGDEDVIVKRVAEHQAAGADHVCVQHLTTSRTEVPMAQWRRLASALL
jgi:probable F420-dependent oxidoreductase